MKEDTESRKMKVNLLMNKAFLQAEEGGDALRKLVAERLHELKKKRKLSESDKQFQVNVIQYLAKRASYGEALDKLHALVQKDPEIANDDTQKAVDEFETLLNEVLAIQEKLEEYIRAPFQPVLNLIQSALDNET